MKLRSTTLALLICLSALALSSATIISTVNMYSQENEYRQVDLSVLGVATGPFTAPSVANTQATLTQPIVASTSTFVPQVLSDVSTSTLELGNGLTQRAQLFTKDVDFAVVQLSITSIQSQDDGTTVVTEIGTYQLPGLLGSTLFNPSVSLFSQNNGILLFSSSSDGKSQIQLFSLDQANKITVVQAAQTLSVNGRHIAASKIAGQIFFLCLQASTNKVWLTQAITGSTTLNGGSSIQACQSLSQQPDLAVDLISHSVSLTLRCFSASSSAVVYEQYSINQSDKTLLLASSGQLSASISSVVQDVQHIGNTLLVLQSLSQQVDQLQLLQIQASGSVLAVDRILFSSSLSISQLIQAVLSPSADLITVITDTQILGINVQTQELLMNYPISSLTAVSLTDFNPFSVNRYQNLIIISLAQITDTATFQALPFYSNIPVFTFTQPAADTTFTVSLPTSLSKTITIVAKLLSGIYPPVTIGTTMNPYEIAQQNQASIHIDLSQYVKGSDMTYTISQFVANQKLTITSTIQQIPASGNGIAVSTTYFKLSDIQGIYSTSQRSIALISLAPLNNQYRFVYCQFQQGNGENQINVLPFTDIYASATSANQVDPNGSFSVVINGFWKVLILQETDTGIVVLTLPTTCPSASSFLFASLPSGKIVATTCSNSLTVYTYTSNDNNILTTSSYSLSYPTQKLTLKVQSMQLSTAGILRITDNLIVFAFDLSSQVYLGFNTVPAATLVTASSWIYLFSDSFIYATATTLTQLGYNNFNGKDAIVLRQLSPQAYTFAYGSDFTKIIQSFDTELFQEYLIVPGTVTSSGSLVNIIYKINSSTTALDQLYTTIAGSATQTSLFGMPNFLGYIDTGNNQIYVYSFSFVPTLVLSYQIGSSDFQAGIQFLQSAVLSYSTFIQPTPQNLNLNLQVVRDLQSVYGSINTTNSQVQSLENMYLKNPLQSNTQLSFTDYYLYNANLLGWQLPQSYNSISLTGSVAQRASIGQTENTDKLSSFVICYPDVILSAKNGQISLNAINVMQISQPAQIFLDSGLSSTSTTGGVSTYQLVFYVLYYNNEGISTSSDFYRIALACNNSTSTIALTGTMDIVHYTHAGLYFDQIGSILTDPNLGLIGLFKSYSSTFYTVKQLVFDANQVLTFNPTKYQAISNLQILSNYFNAATNSIVFFAQDGYAYYSFSADLSTFSVVAVLDSLIGQNQNVQQNSILTQATVLPNGNVLLEFDSSSLFYAAFTTNAAKVISLNAQVSVIHQENQLQFTGQAFVSTSGQIILVSRQQNAPTCVVLIYEPYPQVANHYIAKESAIGYFPVFQNNLQFANNSDGSILILLNSQLLMQSNTFTLTQSSTVDISISTVNVSNGFQGKAFGISPLYINGNDKNTIILSASISGGGTTPTFAGLIRFQIIALLMVCLLGLI